ncbi:MAG: DUF4292 domain-containing protein [Flavobacteriales bacterium]|jgi:hypothetical protein
MIIRLYILLFSLAMMAVGCKSGKDTTQLEPLKDKSAAFLLRRYDRNKFEYDWVGMKIDVDVKTLGETQGFNATVRMKKDSIISISISPALGIEVFQILISPDSVKYISKIPDNKYYYLGGFETITDVAKVDLDFEMLQDILIGNAIGLEKDDAKFRSSVDDRTYLLTSKYKRKVRRVVGIDDRKLAPDDTIVVNPNDPRYQKTVRKSDEEDLVVSRYWLEPDNFRLVRSIFNDLLNQRTVEITYSDFAQEGEQFYPKTGKLQVTDAGQQQEIEFRVKRLTVGKPYEITFEIPEDFERKLPVKQ